jgi:serine/threonine protein phosphatase PrpC
MRLLHPVRQAVFEEAQERDGDANDFASTLLVIVAMPDRTIAAHIGDGAIVVDDGALRVLSWPEQGEYANMTVFLTTQHAVEQARVYEIGPISRFALFSDGLQHIALDYATQDVFAPFIETMLKPLAPPEANRTNLEIALSAYLGSHAVNKRTDDDKTLVLGVRTAR